MLLAATWLLSAAWGMPRWSRARRTRHRDEQLRRLLSGVVVPAPRVPLHDAAVQATTPKAGQRAVGEQGSGQRAAGEQGSGQRAAGEQGFGQRAAGEQGSGQQAPIAQGPTRRRATFRRAISPLTTFRRATFRPATVDLDTFDLTTLRRTTHHRAQATAPQPVEPPRVRLLDGAGGVAG